LGFYIVAIHVSVSICMVEKIWSGLIIAVWRVAGTYAMGQIDPTRSTRV